MPPEWFEGIAEPEPDVEPTAIDAARVRREVCRLPERERRVIRWRYGLIGDEMLLRQIADRMNVSIPYVHQLEQRGLRRLRAAYGLGRSPRRECQPSRRTRR